MYILSWGDRINVLHMLYVLNVSVY